MAEQRNGRWTDYIGKAGEDQRYNNVAGAPSMHGVWLSSVRLHNTAWLSAGGLASDQGRAHSSDTNRFSDVANNPHNGIEHMHVPYLSGEYVPMPYSRPHPGRGQRLKEGRSRQGFGRARDPRQYDSPSWPRLVLTWGRNGREHRVVVTAARGKCSKCRWNRNPM